MTQEGHSWGYKVHVGDLPAQWAQRALRDWAHNVLRARDASLPSDTNTGMGLSYLGRAQLLLTFATSEQAQRAQHLLHQVPIPLGPGQEMRSNAAYWVPRDYDPWENDPRWENVPRPLAR